MSLWQLSILLPHDLQVTVYHGISEHPILVGPSSVKNEWTECLSRMTPYEKITGLDGVFGVWYFNNYLRVTFVSKGWLVVWDHRERPPTRYDCKTPDHQETCELAAILLRDLAKP